MKPLSFITLRRIYGPDNTEDTSSLTVGGRCAIPGTVEVCGGLTHCTKFGPKTEADRLALIAWLNSEECRKSVSA